MPVLSPHRSSSSLSTGGSYRSSFSTSSLDRPFYGTTSSYSPRFSTYSERYTTRTYSDSDGRRLFSRTGSITEDGITTRFRDDSRESSIRRDSRENSILDSRRDSSASRSDCGRGLSAVNVVESVADLRNKYSPANYVPAVLRNKDISRSKTLNDIGLPPLETKKKQVIENNLNTIGVILPNNTNYIDNMQKPDNNGNRPSVSEIRKKFDATTKNSKSRNSPLIIQGAGIKIAQNRFKKQDSVERFVEIRADVESAFKNSEKSSQNGTNLVNECKISEESSTNGRLEKTVFKKSENVEKKIQNGAEYLIDYKLMNKEETQAENSTNVVNVEKIEAKIVKKVEKLIENGIDHQYTSSNNKTPKLLNGTFPIIKTDLDTLTVNTDQKTSKSKVIENGTEFRGTKLGVNNKQEQELREPVTVTHKIGPSKKDIKNAENKSKNINNTNRVNNFASYIPNKDKGDIKTDNNGEMDQNVYSNGGNVKSSSNQKIGKNAGASTSNNVNSSSQRNSLERDSTRNSVLRDANEDDSSAQPSSLTRNRYDRSSPGGKQTGLNGLKNIGNTCFMNSVLQCLSNTKPLLEYVRKDSHTADANTTTSSMKGALIKAFAHLLKELWSEDSSDRVVNTVALKSQIQRFAPRFMGYSQQDAQEFLRYLLEGLHEEVNRVVAKPTPIHTEIEETLSDGEKAVESWQRYIRRENSKIVDIFVGQLKSTLKCTHCGHCSVTFDPFWDLSLPIPQKTGPIRMSQCLDSFTREETLDGDEKPTCSKCKERRKCTKSFTIHKFPKILVIHLKRFSPTERFRGKLSVTVDFPLEGLDMSNYAAEAHSQCRYNLYAISNHSGTTYSGHYTAYCKHPYSLQWHEYNDSRVSSISPKSIVSGEAYVLFYQLDDKMAAHL